MPNPAVSSPRVNKPLKNDILYKQGKHAPYVGDKTFAKSKLPGSAPIEFCRRALQPYGIAVRDAKYSEHRPEEVGNERSIKILKIAGA